ncbi:MAG: hypothetical protein M4579_002158 [Chaenotheca gracillima]|nr:MAG: hypothetical protein M4579_002158 [Chaenotheca gracillima]
MGDFRNLQHYIAQVKADPVHPDDLYEEGYTILRRCAMEAQAVLTATFDTAVLGHDDHEEQTRMQLQRILLDACARRFQAQKIYLCAAAANRWVAQRNSILRGHRPTAAQLPALRAMEAELRSVLTEKKELATITDDRVYGELSAGDYQVGRWVGEDPSLYSIQHWLRLQL